MLIAWSIKQYSTFLLITFTNQSFMEAVYGAAVGL